MPTHEEKVLAVELHTAFLNVSESVKAPPFSIIHASLQLAANIGIGCSGMADVQLHELLQHWIDFVRNMQGSGPKPNA